MTLILNGTDGLSDVDGSAATPAIRGTDANTGMFFPAADTVAIATSGTQRFTVNSSGNIQTVGTISVGNATPSSSGAGITFPATQSASSDANTLDDYEEGSFSPFLTDGTNNTVTGTGFYTKVGRVVTVQIQIYSVAYTSLTAGSLLILAGLPFALNNPCNACFSFPSSTYPVVMTQNTSGNTTLGLYVLNGTSSVDWVNATRTRLGGTSISIYASFTYNTTT
jgi:hypothetical protein